MSALLLILLLAGVAYFYIKMEIDMSKSREESLRTNKQTKESKS